MLERRAGELGDPRREGGLAAEAVGTDPLGGEWPAVDPDMLVQIVSHLGQDRRFVRARGAHPYGAHERAAALEHEGAAARARDRAAVGPGDFRQPTAGDPRAVTRGLDLGARFKVEVADARPDVLPLLADDVVEARDGAGPGAEGHRVEGEQLAAAGEVARADGGLEGTQPLLGCRG